MSLNNTFKAKIESYLMDLISAESSKQMKKMLKDALFPGRRIRPILFLSLTSQQSPVHLDKNLLRIAGAIELAHRASIILDDLIDDDHLRRKLPTFQALYDEASTYLISHYLIYKTYDLLEYLDINIPDIDKLFTIAYGKMIRGELGDTWKIRTRSNYINFYKKVVLEKTAAPFRLLCDLAGIINNSSKKEKELLLNIGEAIGALYQIYNDLYDDLSRKRNERGNQIPPRITLSILPSVILDYGEKQHQDLVLKLLNNGYANNQKRFFKDIYYLRDIFKQLKYEERAFHIAVSSFKETMDKILLLKNPYQRSVLSNFCREISKDDWWNHSNFKSVGY